MKTLGSTPNPTPKGRRNNSMAINRRGSESVYGCAASGDPRDKVKARLPEPQQPSEVTHPPPETRSIRCCKNRAECRWPSETFLLQAAVNETAKVANGAPKSRYHVPYRVNAGSPKGREPHGDGATVVVRERESRLHGKGWQATTMKRMGGARDA